MAWDYNPQTGEEIWIDEDPNSPVPSVSFGGNASLGPELSPEDEVILSAIQRGPESGLSPEQARSKYEAQDIVEAAASPDNNIEMPEDVIVSPPPVSPSSVGQSVSASERALNPETLSYMDTTGLKGYRARDAQAFNQSTSQANEVYSPFVAAAEKERAGISDLGKLKADRVALEANLAGEQQKYMTQLAIDSQRDYEQATAMTREYAARYEAQLKELSTMGVNPGRLYQSMSGKDKANTLFSAFISDFLGAKGIKTSAMSYINQAIDRDIDAQINAINTKGKVADGFRQMWDMQRSQATSDFEAKLRMRGTMLESF